MKRHIEVIIEDREDGGVRVHSDDLRGLILSGQERAKVLGAIGPTVRALLSAKGEDPDVIVDACLVSSRRDNDNERV